MKSRLRSLLRRTTHSCFPAKLVPRIAAPNRRANSRVSQRELAAIPARVSSGLSAVAGIAVDAAVVTIAAAGIAVEIAADADASIVAEVTAAPASIMGMATTGIITARDAHSSSAKC